MTGKINIGRLIGEFLVIFVGVLLAFTVDRWWENRKLIEEEIFAMESIRDDLMKDTSVYNSYQIPLNKERMENIQELISILREQKDSYSMEEVTKGSVIMGINNWNVTTTSYDALKSVGNLKIIRDKALRKSIINYYEAVSANSRFANESHIEFYTQHVLPYILNEANLQDLKASMSIFRDPTFYNRVLLLYDAIALKVKEYEKVSEHSAELIQIINNYLE